MQITGKTRVYKNQYGYSVSDNSKQQNGEWNNFYIPVKFKKELTLPEDKTDIKMTGFTKPFKYKDGKIGISYFITEYEVVGKSTQTSEGKKETDPYELFGSSITPEQIDSLPDLPEDDLPF